MDMIDLYVTEVGKLLPKKKRLDIETEIKSTLEDMLDERSSSSNDQNRDELVMELLKEYGSPAKVAASYRNDQYLIGPGIYSSFLQIIRIVGIIMILTALLGFSFRLGISGITTANLWNQLGNSFTEFVTNIFTAFGIIVLVFAIIERTAPQSSINPFKEIEIWNPGKLKEKPDPKKVNIGSEIEGIIFNLLALLVFNVYPELIAVKLQQGSSLTFIPLLTQRFFDILPLLNIVWVVGILLNLFLIYRNQKTLFTNILEIMFKVVGIAIAVMLLSGPQLITLRADFLSIFSISNSNGEIIQKIINVGIDIGLINFILVTIFGIGKITYHLMNRQGFTVLQIKN